MPAKRAASADCAPKPSPTKKGKSSQGTGLAPAQSAQHPTLLQLETGLSHMNALPFWKSPQVAKAAGGLDEFDIDAYKHSMRQHKEYSCVVPANAIHPTTTVHPHAVPGWGTLKFAP